VTGQAAPAPHTGPHNDHTLIMAMSSRGVGGAGADNCIWLPQFKGSQFVVASNINLVCGTVITTQSPPSS
jgi:branched-chain amino acid transport system substrate-binding protein